MALIDDVKQVCDRLAPQGWGPLLLKHGLDITSQTSQDLRNELDKELPGIDRDVPGFEDFAFEGIRGIEPGNPNRSLLYHALASPNVLKVDGADLGEYPTLRDLEIVENYVFGAKPPSLPELSALAGGDLMAVVVFATEYRPAVDTVHRKHAELCFSRTGVARVGNAPASYNAQSRGFIPFVDGDDFAFRVLPARYSIWIAVQRPGTETSFGPMRFDFRSRVSGVSDTTRKFWVPIHKVFSGTECIRGLPLETALRAHHVNEKIRRIHLELAKRGHGTGWSFPDIDEPPFRFTEGIADFSGDAAFGSGLLVPAVHSHMVKPAEYRGQPLTFLVPPDSAFSSTLEIASPDRIMRPAPEYVHVRHAPGQPVENLNDLSGGALVQKVQKGDYQAQHYVDFTGDGWIEPSCPQLRPQFPRFINAYSIVTAPDFYFNCDQREVMDWWLQKAPEALRNFLWETAPLTLSDERLAPNLKLNNVDFRAGDPALPKANFRPEDDTVTAIVSMPLRAAVRERPQIEAQRNRHTHLPDTAAGVFAPGWDTSRDVTGTASHLAAYGLGSPFPEDSKLCAALSTFWPAVAPDAGRSFSQVFPTVSPMTDEELGQTGALPWDGTPGPRIVAVNGTDVVEYARFEHVDYVEKALDNEFSLQLTSRVRTREYVARVLAMARAYRALGVSTSEGKSAWNVLSFRAVQAQDAELQAAITQTGFSPGGEVFRFEMYQPAGLAPNQPNDHRKRHLLMGERRVLFVGGEPEILVKPEGGAWQVRRVLV